MAQPTIPRYLESAFEPGFSFTHPENYIYNFYVATIGNLKINEGKIVACDPFFYVNDLPYAADFPKGEFPVQLAVAKINDDERVGFARIKFSDKTPVRWELALTEDQSLDDLKNENQIFGYGADGGTGGFMEPAGATAFTKILEDNSDNYQLYADEMQKNYKNTWSWLLWEQDANMVAMFSTGWGDGFYATYIGYDANNGICRLVTDFVVIE
ncbi:MAG: DUF4241 domain-containing protein [Chitinophagaceae bacterium]